MRKLLLVAAMVFCVWSSMAQADSYSDDFESYTVGDFIGIVNPTWWTTWSNSPGTGEDAYVSAAFANSPTKSLFVDPDDGLTDLILKLGDKTSGAYEVDWYMYVETGYQGYYNFQHFESPGTEWAFEIWFYDDGTGELLVGDVYYPFTYPQGTWFKVEHDINIDDDLASFTANGTVVHTWPFSYEGGGTGGTNQLGGVDFWTDDVTYRFYIDDLMFAPMPIPLYEDDFESYTVGDYIGIENPTWWTTWSNSPGTGEDAYISAAFANSPTKSLFVDPDDGLTDLILKLGDKTSGAYEVNWYMYVESGYQAYYNFQHFESPGTEWAFEIWFYDDGTGELLVGDVYYPFTYPQGTWFPVEHNINIDDDLASFTMNGTEVHSWPFSYESDGTSGTNQLGGVDFWTDDVSYRFYIDDLAYIQAATSQDAAIAITPEQVEATGPQGFTTTVPLTVTNEGTGDLSYAISVIYPAPSQKSGVISLDGQAAPVRSLGYSNQASTDPDASPASYNPPPTDDFVLHYDGDNFSAIGWNSPPISPIVAAMFPTNLTLPHAGLMLTSVDIYLNDPGTDFILKIYDMGTSYQPGTLLVSQPFGGQSLSWNSVTLDNPVYITGADIWIGYQFTQATAEIFIPGTDEGPADPNGDFISTGVGWSHLSSNPDLNYNWNIRANLTGTPIEQWLSISPASGLITPGNADQLTITCDATNLETGTYSAFLRIISNDPENEQIDVPVTFMVTEGGTQVSVNLDFESQADWALTFEPWTAIDNDNASTYGIEDYDFPNAGIPMAYIAFNPATTTPPMTDDPEIQPHDGVRFGACMNSVPPPFNDDWIISPQTTLGTNSNLTFWVKSYTDDYGLEKYNVLVSTTDMNLESFTSISGSTPMLAPMIWTEINYDLSTYDGQTVYVAIQCVSEDAFIFMIDDISIDFIVGVPDAPQEMEIAIYPNPVTDQLYITSGVEMTQVEIFNHLGQKVYSQVLKDTNFSMDAAGLNAGVYYIRITSDEGNATKKIMVK